MASYFRRCWFSPSRCVFSSTRASTFVGTWAVVGLALPTRIRGMFMYVLEVFDRDWGTGIFESLNWVSSSFILNVTIIILIIMSLSLVPSVKYMLTQQLRESMLVAFPLRYKVKKKQPPLEEMLHVGQA